MSSSRPHLVVNPAAGCGRTGRGFDRIARAVRDELGEFDCSFTRGPGDGVRLAREAVEGGSRLVTAVGGDGTASEVIEGISGSGTPGVLFGFIPQGTGSDLRRTLGYPMDPAAAARIVASGREWVCDLGRVEFVGSDGAPRVRHFVNEAGCGISARAVQEVERLGKSVGGRIAYLLGAGKALVGWRDQAIRWRLDGGAWRNEAITCLSVCNGRYFGGGMMVAPDARMDDGLFDVTVWSRLGFLDLMTKRPMLYDGSHVRLPNTQRFRGRTVEIEPAGDDRVLLELDGEQPGTLPARFTILPGALRLRIARD
ncbi:MAG TPA: diacylglycerol kinase family protein [Anaeromyxobacteraceae bacterium]|nr:diacylglycerol kinase family protein [Anaeromyxobacteraceae bacterium]